MASIYDARSFWELLERRVAASPDAPMLQDVDDREITFAEFKAWAERVAAGLAEIGIGEGSHVTWQLPTRIETVVASFALSRLGAIQNPIIQIYREREVGFAIRQTKAELVIVPGVWRGFDYVAMVERIAETMDTPPQILVAYDSLPEADPATLPPVAAPPTTEDAAPVRWIYYTSGTTSDPKGVQHTDATLLAGGIGLAKAINITVDDVGTIAFPYAHIGGPDYIVTVLAEGFPVLLLETFVLADAVEVFRRKGATMAGGSTAFYIGFLNEQRKNPSEKLIPTLRVLSGGGAPKPPEVFFEIKAEMGIPVAHGYGMTECPMIAQGGPQDSDDQLAYSEGAPVYRCEVSIVRADGTDADAGEEGEVRLAGPMLFKGYTDESLNEAAFDEQGRFRTGDLGIKRIDGHITLTGRLKDVIIRKGENISAKEIEDAVYTHPAIADVGVIALPDRARGEMACAVAVVAAGHHPPSLDELVDHCRRAGLSSRKLPERLEFVDVLPRNPTGKVVKYELQARFAEPPV